jgi:hypothetical protein
MDCGTQGECSMRESEELSEQRNHKRLFPKSLVFAVSERFLFGIGQVVDISGGGVAFQYAYDSCGDWDLLQGSLKLDLFKSKPSRNVIGVECNVVYDTEVPNQNNLSGGYRLRRCAVEFAEHNWYQSIELDLFIKDFTAQEN